MKRLATFILATSLGGTAWAGEGTISASYDVAVKGVNVMKLRYAANLTENGYSANLSAKTKGMANWLSDYRIEYSSQGLYGKTSVFQPKSFTRERKKNGKKSEAVFVWKSGAPSIDESEVSGAERASAAVSTGSTDPLALLLTIGFNGTENPCKGKHRVFDGRDVMDIAFSRTGGASDSVSCKLTAKTIAGRSYEKADDKSALIDIYTVVFKETAVPFLNRKIKVPVEITGRASGQDFVATVDNMDISGSPTN
jgi:hypothetical protein